MVIAIGLIIGLIIGSAQLFLLTRFVARITGGEMNTASALLGTAQLLFPFAALLIVALAWRDALLWVGVGAGTGLALGALALFLRRRKK